MFTDSFGAARVRYRLAQDRAAAALWREKFGPQESP
jgi:hypothetical protein